MQPVACPRCRHESTYDPWVAPEPPAAQLYPCPNCGHDNTGSIVTVRYANRDPSIASIRGNEGLCIGTTGLTLFVLAAVVMTLCTWACGP
jgi:hypothetical protein